MSRLDEFFKEQKLVADFTKLVFDQIKYVLTTGAVFYIVGRYSESAAKSISFMLISLIVYPIITPMIAAAVYNKWLRFIIHLIISIACSYFFIDNIASLVALIESKP